MHRLESFVSTILLSCVCLFMVSAPVSAAPIVAISYTGNGVFTITGKDLTNAGGFDIRVRYDQAVLSNPRVDKGDLLASALMNTKTSDVGSVNIAAAVAQGVTKTEGVLATITFTVNGSLQGVIKGFDYNVALIDNSNNPNTGGTSTSGTSTGGTSTGGTSTGGTSTGGTSTGGTSTGGTSTGGTSTGGTSTGGTSTGGTSTGGTSTGGTGSTNIFASSSATISIGTVALPTDQFAAAEKKEDAQPLYTDLRKDLAGKAKEGEDKPKDEAADDKTADKFVSYQGALPLFRKLAGEKSPNALMLLFADQAVAGFKQDPPILLTDGKAKVKLSVGARLLGKETPSFAVSSAKILSLVPEEDGSWTLVVQPKQGTVDSVLSISSGNGGADIPLLVAPIVDSNITKSGKLSEADFALFLKETGTPKAPRFDLNADGKRDYLDDYIFTANYLVKMKIKPESLKPKEADQKGKDKEPGKKTGKVDEKGKPGATAAKETRPVDAKPAVPEKKTVPNEQK